MLIYYYCVIVEFGFLSDAYLLQEDTEAPGASR